MTNYQAKINNSKNIRNVFITFIIYLLSFHVFMPEGIPSTLIHGTQFICGLLIVYALLSYSKFKNVSTGKIWLCTILLWYAFILIRGNYDLPLKELSLKITSPYTLYYFLPLLAFFPLRKHFRQLLKLFFYFSLISIPIWLLNINHLVVQMDSDNLFIGESIGQYLPFFSAFLLLFIKEFSKPKQKLIWLVFIIYFVLMILNARRNIILSFSLYFIGFLIFSNKINITKPQNVLFLICLSFGIIFAFNSPDLLEKYFPLIFKRGFENSRTGVEEFFIVDYLGWDNLTRLIGKGLDGSYYQPIIDPDTGNIITDQRLGIETGYLDMILKGGIIYDVLILLTILYSIIIAIRSKDSISRRCAYVLFLSLIDMYSTSLLGSLKVKSLLFWICIGLILSFKENRRVTNNGKGNESIV